MARGRESDRGERAAAPADPPRVREEGVTVNPETAETAARRREASQALPRAPGATSRRRGKGESYEETAKKRRAVRETDRLQEDLRAFAAARPSGWGHDDWLAFLETLKERGHDTSEPDRIGLELERERLAVVLAGVRGLGPQRVRALVDRFDTLWSLRHAGAEQVAAVEGIPRAVAERVVEAVRAAPS